MTPWRFEGASDPNRQNSGSFPLSGAAGFICSAREQGWPQAALRRRGRGWPGRRSPRSWAAAGVAAAAACGCAAGLIQQAWTRLFSGLGDLGIDLAAKPGQAAERRLDMAAGAAEPVVEIEVTKGGIEIVEPHQAHDAAAEPDAFGVSGRAIDGLGGFDELVGLALVVPWRRRPAGRHSRAGFARLILGVGVAALGSGASGTDQERKPGDGEVAQNRILKLKHPSTHKFPDLLPARGLAAACSGWFDAVQIGPQCGGDAAGFP